MDFRQSWQWSCWSNHDVNGGRLLIAEETDGVGYSDSNRLNCSRTPSYHRRKVDSVILQEMETAIEVPRQPARSLP